MDPHKAEDARIIQLCREAFYAEHRGQFADAQRQHRVAVTSLSKLVDDARWLDRERKRVARKQIKFHSGRVEKLQAIVQGRQQALTVVLPSALTMQESLTQVAPNGRLPIGLEEIWLSNYLNTKEQNPTQPVEPGFQHLLQNPVPAYTPTLDLSLPKVTYHIYNSIENAFPAGRMCYFKAKSATDDRQTLYVLQALKRFRYQINVATLHRATEFTSPCVQVAIDAVQPDRSSLVAAMKGRGFRMAGMSRRLIHECQDRERERDWGFRRFHWAGREFVWETSKNPYHFDRLYEVAKSWPKPGSKTGKRDQQLVGKPLVWGEMKTGIKKIGMIHMVGGLDQAFIEHVLASQLARLAILYHGHD